MTMKEWAERWMEADVRPKVRPTTYEAKRYVLQNHILTKLGDIPLSDLTEVQIGSFLDERKRFGSHRPESAEYPGLSQVTMRHIHRCLQECLDSAVSTGMIPVNPARAFHYPTQRKVKASVLGDSEVEDYLDAAEALGYLPMFTLMLTIGLRQRELLALKWSDLDERTGILTVWSGRSVVKGKLKDYGGNTRQIPLSIDTIALLRQEHNRHPSSEAIFVHSGTRKPYAPAMVRLLHQRIIEKAGLDHIRFEDLRHTVAVHALESKTEAKTVSALLGHTRPYVGAAEVG
ncbi:tyrosine-type recombinase/integrase [Oscillibacter sp.]|uniref:tyrosine-type recombinase/integrase n=1 Tax=Oscillibacter sp. TaxID=1945593 RepID=UPI003396664D